MKKIIKQGQPITEKTCPYCGCVFTYTPDELMMCNKEIGESYAYVTCPCCDHEVKCINEKDNTVKGFEMHFNNPSFVSSASSRDHCKTCSFYINCIQSDRAYIGDSPCEWCSNNPYKITCTNTVATSGSSHDIDDYMKGKK